MHPIERLRHVARASGVPEAILLRETANAMMSFADNPAGLLTACRRMVSRQPESGAQVSLAARMLTAPDPRQAAWEAVEEREEDTSARTCVRELPDAGSVCLVGWPDLLEDHLYRRGDLKMMFVLVESSAWGLADRFVDRDIDAFDVDASGVGAAAREADVTVLEAVAAGPTEALVRRGGLAAAAVAHACGREVWLCAPAGIVLPEKMWTGLIGRYEASGEPWDLEYETVPASLLSRVYGPAGTTGGDVLASHSSCPVAPELFAS